VDELGSLPDEVLAAVAAYEFVTPRPQEDPWRGPTAWRLGRTEQPAAVARAGVTHRASVSARLDGSGVEVRVGPRRLAVRSLGEAISVEGHPVSVTRRERISALEWQGRRYRVQRVRPLRIEDTLGRHGTAAGAGRLTAPMPGRIAKIAVEVGEQVRPNQPLVVLEAMKMEHVVEAPHAGVIRELCVELGQQVTAGTVLVELGDVE
jgi:acetyl/propionyl-CoA carboxylase alpha subunit